jgi:hypothetical protein
MHTPPRYKFLLKSNENSSCSVIFLEKLRAIIIFSDTHSNYSIAFVDDFPFSRKIFTFKNKDFKTFRKKTFFYLF